MFAEAALLLAFVTKKLRDGKPFDGLFIIALGLGNHAGEGGSHLRAERNSAFAFIYEIIELADDFIAAFGRIEFQCFERRAIVFGEAVTAGGFAPVGENEIAE